MNRARLLVPIVVGVLLAALLMNALRPDGSSADLTYSGLIAQVESDPAAIDEVVFVPNKQNIEVAFADGRTADLHRVQLVGVLAKGRGDVNGMRHGNSLHMGAKGARLSRRS